MGRKWTTKEQESWLKDQLPDYVEAKARGIASSQLIAIHSQWFAAFPERAVLFPSLSAEERLSSEQEDQLGKAVTARKQVCHTYYTNQ